MSDKEHIESHVARMFLERREGTRLTSDAFCFGDPEKCEPDILYKDIGFEIGAVLKRTNTHIDVYEKRFLSAATERISGKIPETFQIRLVMQDDSDTVEHTPAHGFQSYKYLPKYLDGVFINKYRSGKVDQQVTLNQKTRMRSLTFPSNPSSKEFSGFIDELAVLVNALQESDFEDHEGCKLHHSVVTEGRVVKCPIHPLDEFVSRKIIDKLSKNKYSGTYSTQILLLHNYSVLGSTEFTTDIHFYTHHRDDVFNLLWNHIEEHKSFQFYNGIYFLDFSVYAFNINFELVDFANYSPRVPNEFLRGYDEMRCDLRSVITTKSKE